MVLVRRSRGAFAPRRVGAPLVSWDLGTIGSQEPKGRLSSQGEGPGGGRAWQPGPPPAPYQGKPKGGMPPRRGDRQVPQERYSIRRLNKWKRDRMGNPEVPPANPEKKDNESFYRIFVPGGTGERGVRSDARSPAARSIAWLSRPKIFAGFRFTTTTISFPTSDSTG